MKKIIGLLLGLASVCTLSACDLTILLGGGETSGSVQSGSVTSESVTSESVTSEETGEHKHSLTRVAEKKASCAEAGNKTYYICDCGEVFLDAMGTKATTLEEVLIEKEDHVLKHTAGVEATCISSGRIEYWGCSSCNQLFADEACTQVVLKSQTTLPKAAHDLTHYAAQEIVGSANGVKEHWVCAYCEGYFLDEACKKPTTPENTILYSAWNVPDFIVEVPVGREPVVLQLTDTQIMDSSQDINGVLAGSQPTMYAPGQMNARCFDYLTDIITATNPDLIILTGDNVYGKFDHNGSVWTKFVNFMDSFDIPWAPIFGNHDNESNMGVDWQCEQLMKAENCLFKQRTLTGNCNYSVAIAQGNEIKRVFYMLDSNGIGSPSAATLANGHTSTIPGLASDQVAWYTEEITRLQDSIPDIKISFAYHIQDTLFELAYAKYGYVTWEPWANINVDLHEDKAEGDFGYIGYVRGEWTQNIDDLKALGVDSIFVGHEHTSSSSVVYEGIRFQFGQKSSRYDMFSVLDANGNVKHTDYEAATDSPLIGGSVIVLSEEDGAIADAYIYYCDDAHGKIANGEIQWSSFLPTTARAILPRKEELL